MSSQTAVDAQPKSVSLDPLMSTDSFADTWALYSATVSVENTTLDKPEAKVSSLDSQERNIPNTADKNRDTHNHKISANQNTFAGYLDTSSSKAVNTPYQRSCSVRSDDYYNKVRQTKFQPRFQGDTSHIPLSMLRRRWHKANQHTPVLFKVDIIDRLDESGPFYHHEGPYDAVDRVLQYNSRMSHPFDFTQ